MEITGIIKRIEEAEQINPNFSKRDLVLVTDEQYPQTLLIQFKNTKTGLLDTYAEGEKVKVSINLQGREWTNSEGKTLVFNTLSGWKIKVVEENSQQKKGQPKTFIGQEDDDDLPF